jgi:hypothetical protein
MFNFMETLFVFSLGITFLLLLLLIYHFKQRLSAVEQKHDVLLEILNTVVQETHTIKAVLATVWRPPTPDAPTKVEDEELVDDLDVEQVSEDDDDVSVDNELLSEDDDEDDEIEVKELEEEEEQEPRLSVVLKNLEEVVPETANLEEVVPETTNLEEVVPETTNLLDKVPVTETVASVEEEIKANVLDLLESDGDLDDVQRMKLPALRELAVQRGLVADASKMKKPELLELLK